MDWHYVTTALRHVFDERGWTPLDRQGWRFIEPVSLDELREMVVTDTFVSGEEQDDFSIKEALDEHSWNALWFHYDSASGVWPTSLNVVDADDLYLYLYWEAEGIIESAILAQIPKETAHDLLPSAIYEIIVTNRVGFGTLPSFLFADGWPVADELLWEAIVEWTRRAVSGENDGGHDWATFAEDYKLDPTPAPGCAADSEEHREVLLRRYLEAARADD